VQMASQTLGGGLGPPKVPWQLHQTGLGEEPGNGADGPRTGQRSEVVHFIDRTLPISSNPGQSWTLGFATVPSQTRRECTLQTTRGLQTAEQQVDMKGGCQPGGGARQAKGLKRCVQGWGHLEDPQAWPAPHSPVEVRSGSQ
jgi:hypothetical protein